MQAGEDAFQELGLGELRYGQRWGGQWCSVLHRSVLCCSGKRRFIQVFGHSPTLSRRGDSGGRSGTRGFRDGVQDRIAETSFPRTFSLHRRVRAKLIGMPPPLPALNAIPRRVRWVLAAVSGAVVLWLMVAVQLFVNVDPSSVHRTDAVIMLGGAASERLPVAQRLQNELNAPVLVLSHTDTLGNAAADDVCSTATFPDPRLVCFRPSGMDTRSEADIIADLADANGWKSVTVVTSSYHVTRAGRLIGQCTTADVQMVASHPALSPGQWLRRFVIETGGLIDASLRPECADQRAGM